MLELIITLLLAINIVIILCERTNFERCIKYEAIINMVTTPLMIFLIIKTFIVGKPWFFVTLLMILQLLVFYDTVKTCKRYDIDVKKLLVKPKKKSKESNETSQDIIV